MAKQKNKSKSKQSNNKSRSKGSSSRNSFSFVDDASFRSSFQTQGHTINEMESDGNCLFRSLSDQLYRDSGAQHALVRNEICNHLSRHRESFECFLLMNDEDEDIIDFDDYVVKMREDGEWGGNVELVVASRVFKRNIRIYSGLFDGGVMLIQYQEEEKDDRDYKKQYTKGKEKKGYQYCEYDEQEGIVHFGDLLLSYHDNDHYNSVHSITDKSNEHSKACEISKIDDNSTTDVPSSSIPLSKNSPKPRKGADCPCGSGIKYKKCCATRDKSLARVAKLKEKGVDITEDEKKDDANHEFKVLTI